MVLVSYSDSEASDSEQETVPQPPSDKKDTHDAPPTQPKSSTSTSGPNNFQPIVDRSNPRKIRVALPEIKPDPTADGENQDEPARKKPRIGEGGGAFSGFNSMLPAPKKNTPIVTDKKGPSASRKVFSLKTGAEPGFSREADEEMRWEQAAALGGNGDDATIPKAGSLQTGPEQTVPKKEEPKLKGNAMMFKPLSVGRNQKKRKPVKTTASPVSALAQEQSKPPLQQQKEEQQTTVQPAPPKPKVSLFSLSTDDTSTSTPETSTDPASGYQPLMYNATHEAPPAGPERPAPELMSEPTAPTSSDPQAPTLDNIAEDLNLSRSERRQLFGRHDISSKSRVLTFNTDKEYAANQELLHTTDLAAAQHNPVRAIAPGKHTLQQLVNAASTQREALEDSFAAGRRNKKEAGSKYGW